MGIKSVYFEINAQAGEQLPAPVPAPASGPAPGLRYSLINHWKLHRAEAGQLAMSGIYNIIHFVAPSLNNNNNCNVAKVAAHNLFINCFLIIAASTALKYVC